MKQFFLAALVAAGLAAPALADDANKLVIDVPTIAPPTAAAPKQRIICRRDVEIGSFVKGVRRCGTVSEWRKAEDAAQYITNRIQEQKSRYPG